jgi:hypothetical protein
MANEDVALPEASSTAGSTTRHVIIRPYPKVIFFYLTWVICMVCGVIMAVTSGSEAETAEHWARLAGLLFFYIFAFNLLVVAFEFTRILSIAVLFMLGMFLFLGLWLSTKWDFLSFLKVATDWIDPRMNANFFLVMFAAFTVVYLIVFITTRFNYWEIQPNEILHHHGFMGDVERYPAPSLRMSKEINDVVEYVLLRSGRLILQPSSERQAIVLECVININRVEDRVKDLLGSLQVNVKGD